MPVAAPPAALAAGQAAGLGDGRQVLHLPTDTAYGRRPRGTAPRLGLPPAGHVHPSWSRARAGTPAALRRQAHARRTAETQGR